MNKKKAVILGGGYAGLSAAIGLSRPGKFDVTVVDSRDHHLAVTHLHKTVSRPIETLRVSGAQIAGRFGFHWKRATSDLSGEAENAFAGGLLKTDAGSLEYDYLILAQGARPISLAADSEEQGGIFAGEERVRREGAQPILEKLNDGPVVVIGTGATGVQFAFSILDRLKNAGKNNRVILTGMDDVFLNGFPAGFDTAVRAKAAVVGMELMPGCRFAGYEPGQLHLQRRDGGEFRLDAEVTFCFAGIRPNEREFQCRATGQVVLENRVLENVFACGDNSVYAGAGLNRKSAQAAVRKGKLCADNILRLERSSRLGNYGYAELGYFVSLGDFDGVGWLFTPGNILRGPAALGLKELIEAQFSLFLRGLDLYLI